jgi:hypothetical protein
MFEALEESRAALGVRDYRYSYRFRQQPAAARSGLLCNAPTTNDGVRDCSLSQTSLEQIFNSFASQQDEETGAVAGMGPAGNTTAQ